MSLLFSPVRIGSMELANRIVSLPMYLALPDRDNEVNELVLEYYDEMARSGASIIVPGRMSKGRRNAQSHAGAI
jgi:2,4-dienoyl-CoA reductase-like NADH-dependent reductase (Old Yellow Enzyme family)